MSECSELEVTVHSPPRSGGGLAGAPCVASAQITGDDRMGHQ